MERSFFMSAKLFTSLLDLILVNNESNGAPLKHTTPLTYIGARMAEFNDIKHP